MHFVAYWQGLRFGEGWGLSFYWGTIVVIIYFAYSGSASLPVALSLGLGNPFDTLGYLAEAARSVPEPEYRHSGGVRPPAAVGCGRG